MLDLWQIFTLYSPWSIHTSMHYKIRCMQAHVHKHLACWLIVHCTHLSSNTFLWLVGGQSVGLIVMCFMTNIEARQLFHCCAASSSRGPRVKQHGESWDVITQSVCAILIKTLLTVLHYWNTPHRTLLNSLNKLAPAPLIIHRIMSAFFLSRRG